MPISCEHPLVQIWLQHVGALQKAWCWLTTGDAGMAQCRATSSQEQCTTFWTPFTLVAVLALASLSWISLCAWLIRKAIRK